MLYLFVLEIHRWVATAPYAYPFFGYRRCNRTIHAPIIVTEARISTRCARTQIFWYREPTSRAKENGSIATDATLEAHSRENADLASRGQVGVLVAYHLLLLHRPSDPLHDMNVFHLLHGRMLKCA
jgi:hypothetical protein